MPAFDTGAPPLLVGGAPPCAGLPAELVEPPAGKTVLPPLLVPLPAVPLVVDELRGPDSPDEQPVRQANASNEAAATWRILKR